MITGTEMYWLTRLTSVKNGVEVIGIVVLILSAAAGFLGFMGWLLEESEGGKKSLKFSIPAFILGGIIAFCSVFIPTTKEMCAIKAIPMIANNEQVQELPNKVVELANEWIDELKPNKESE